MKQQSNTPIQRFFLPVKKKIARENHFWPFCPFFHGQFCFFTGTFLPFFKIFHGQLFFFHGQFLALFWDFSRATFFFYGQIFDFFLFFSRAKNSFHGQNIDFFHGQLLFFTGKFCLREMIPWRDLRKHSRWGPNPKNPQLKVRNKIFQAFWKDINLKVVGFCNNLKDPSNSSPNGLKTVRKKYLGRYENLTKIRMSFRIWKLILLPFRG